MAKGHGTFCRTVPDAIAISDNVPGGKPKKLKKDGVLPSFTTNYRPNGSREQPNAVTPGDPFARMRNRYGEGDNEPSEGMMIGSFGPFR